MEAVSGNHPIPILSGVSIRKDQDVLIFTASNTNMTIEYRISLTSSSPMEQEDGAIVVPARYLYEIVRKLEPGAIRLETHSLDVDFRSLTNAILDAHYGVNVRGTCMLSAAFARHLEGKQGGRIINLVSGQDKGPMPGNLAYVATKGAISAFTVSLAAERAPLHITVNAVDPGPTDSGWMNEDIKQHFTPKFPMGRLGQQENAARLITFLASDEAAWVTGQIIHSDGVFWG
ncbi:SDR family oxidoreductase [Paenibacillus sp. NPDC057934]|uniref:SDR family oxidoreductase n=1 Tax=Paenibacillus sp. NPDC057934 TaxID=3346282 RepID=UPI0036DEB68E